jgi:hypothetical protein
MPGFTRTCNYCRSGFINLFQGEVALLSADRGRFECRCADLKVGERPVREL